MESIASIEEQKRILQGKTTKLPFSANSLQIMAKRYLLTDYEGNILETPEDMFRRVANAIANVEKEYGMSEKDVKKLSEDFYEIMSNLEFTPAGRTISNAGTPFPLIFNCIVLHAEDSMEGIFQTLKDAALLQQAGAGLGFPIHLLRPAGTIAKRSRGVASGPVSFLKVYDQAFGVVKQQNRHGANMAVMRVDHPDILEFIDCKKTEGVLKNFNISVGLTDEFMKAVKNNSKEPWLCEWKGHKIKPRIIKRDRYETVVGTEEVTITAKEIFDRIIENAWSNGEPGCVFLDEVNRTNPLPGLGRIEACNPCGEQFLHDGDVCNLGSINLEKFVKDEKIDFDRLRFVVRNAVRMLDNVIDLSDFPVQKVNDTARNNRRIGLGIMGFADMLYLLKIPYNSEEGRKVAEKVMNFINEEAHKTSMELAKKKDVFPNWDLSIYKNKNIPMRNAALTNIAPTGTISMMFDCSGGIEPYFALAYYYKGILDGKTKLFYMNKHLKKVLKERNLFSEKIIEKIIEKGTLKNIKEIPEDIKRVFVTAMDISAEDHILMQASFQKYIDNSISKTINFPQNATKEDVRKGYIMAWELGCKGCTVYRDKSREEQVLNIGKIEDKKENRRQEKEKKENKLTDKKSIIKSGKCPECGSPIFVSEGCYTCKECGNSACGL